jgi:peptidoglycan/LPS O-acetylase OafA/YrhL
MHKTAGRLSELDALRGIAASAVVLFHLTKRYFDDYGRPDGAIPAFPIEGMQGVFLFFVLSGFVISMTLERTRSRRDFARARFSRIFPAYWAAVALTFAVVHGLGLPGREVSLPVALFNLTLLQAYVGVANVDGVYWSLAAELSFYCVAYALHARGWLWQRPHRVAWIWLGYCAAHALAHRLLGATLRDAIAWLTLARFAPLFIAGMMFYRLFSGWRTRETHAVIAAAFVLHNLIQWEGKAQLPCTLLTFACFYGVAYGRLSFIAARPLLWLGAISYPLYLVHDNVGMAVMRKLTALGVPYNAALPLVIALVVLLAAAISAAIERPALRALRAPARRGLPAARVLLTPPP